MDEATRNKLFQSLLESGSCWSWFEDEEGEEDQDRLLTYRSFRYSGRETGYATVLLDKSSPYYLMFYTYISIRISDGHRAETLEYLNPSEWNVPFSLGLTEGGLLKVSYFWLLPEEIPDDAQEIVEDIIDSMLCLVEDNFCKVLLSKFAEIADERLEVSETGEPDLLSMEPVNTYRI